MADQADRGITVVFTTHEPAIAVEVAAYAVLMRAGDALAVGTAGRVLTAENLSRTYRARVDIVDVPGRRVVVPHYDLCDNEREGEGN
jgi:ABC-type cobalamin/Fe3+-siderophores transport system ATPase subunit